MQRIPETEGVVLNFYYKNRLIYSYVSVTGRNARLGVNYISVKEVM